MSGNNKNIDDYDEEYDESGLEESGLRAFLVHPRKKQMLVVAAVFCVLFLGVLISVVALVDPAEAKKKNSESSESAVTPAETSVTPKERSSEETPKSNIPKKTSEENKASLDVTLVPGYVFPDDSVGNPDYKPPVTKAPVSDVTKKPEPTKKADPTPVPVKKDTPTPTPEITAEPTQAEITAEPTQADITAEPTEPENPVPTDTPVPTEEPEVTSEPTPDPGNTENPGGDNTQE